MKMLKMQIPEYSNPLNVSLKPKQQKTTKGK